MRRAPGFCWRSGGADWQPRSDVEHRAILGKLESGDIEGSAALLRNHILDGGRALMHQLAGDYTGGNPR